MGLSSPCSAFLAMSRWLHSPGNLPTSGLVFCLAGVGDAPESLLERPPGLGFPEPIRKLQGLQKRVGGQGPGARAETPSTFILSFILLWALVCSLGQQG